LTVKLTGLKKNEVVIAVIPSGSYKKKSVEIVKQLTSGSKSVCYVNTTIGHDALSAKLKKLKVKEDKILFIDAISKKPKEEEKNCIYTGSLHALTDLSITIKNVLGTKKFEVLLFDSLSSLTNYHNVNSLTRFTHDLFGVVKKSGAVGVFTMPKGSSKELMADIGMFADKVVEVKG
jgi:hypothetical protein